MFPLMLASLMCSALSPFNLAQIGVVSEAQNALLIQNILVSESETSYADKSC